MEALAAAALQNNHPSSIPPIMMTDCNANNTTSAATTTTSTPLNHAELEVKKLQALIRKLERQNEQLMRTRSAGSNGCCSPHRLSPSPPCVGGATTTTTTTPPPVPVPLPPSSALLLRCQSPPSSLGSSFCSLSTADLFSSSFHTSGDGVGSEEEDEEEDSVLDGVELLDLDSVSPSDDDSETWLYESSKARTGVDSPLTPVQWCRMVLDRPKSEVEVARRSLSLKLDQVSRWRSMFSPCNGVSGAPPLGASTLSRACSTPQLSERHAPPISSPVHPILQRAVSPMGREAAATSDRTPTFFPHLGNRNRSLQRSASSPQPGSNMDGELSVASMMEDDDMILQGYKLNDLTDVQVMARLQEENLRAHRYFSFINLKRSFCVCVCLCVRAHVACLSSYACHSIWVCVLSTVCVCFMFVCLAFLCMYVCVCFPVLVCTCDVCILVFPLCGCARVYVTSVHTSCLPPCVCCCRCSSLPPSGLRQDYVSSSSNMSAVLPPPRRSRSLSLHLSGLSAAVPGLDEVSDEEEEEDYGLLPPPQPRLARLSHSHTFSSIRDWRRSTSSLLLATPPSSSTTTTPPCPSAGLAFPQHHHLQHHALGMELGMAAGLGMGMAGMGMSGPLGMASSYAADLQQSFRAGSAECEYKLRRSMPNLVKAPSLTCVPSIPANHVAPTATTTSSTTPLLRNSQSFDSSSGLARLQSSIPSPGQLQNRVQSVGNFVPLSRQPLKATAYVSPTIKGSTSTSSASSLQSLNTTPASSSCGGVGGGAAGGSSGIPLLSKVTGGGAPAATSSATPPRSSGLPRPASFIGATSSTPRGKLSQPARSLLTPPKSLSTFSALRDTSWRDGCY